MCCRHNLAWVRDYIEHDSDPDQNRTIDNQTVLSIAAFYASVDVAALLLKFNGKLEGSRALRFASKFGRRDMMGFLLQNDVHVYDIGAADWGKKDTPEIEGGVAGSLFEKDS